MRKWIEVGGLLLLICLSEGMTQAQERGGELLLAADVLSLNIDIDTTVDIAGETRFFSSRPNRYAGGRIMSHLLRPGQDPDDFLTWGVFSGLMWGKSKFLLNWEEPGLWSFPPLNAYFTTFTWPVGLEARLRFGPVVTLSPYCSAKFMFINMKVEIEDEDFGHTALKTGLGTGVKMSLKLGNTVIAGGVGWTHILGEEIDFEMDDSLTFNGNTDGPSVEYFLGVQL